MSQTLFSTVKNCILQTDSRYSQFQHENMQILQFKHNITWFKIALVIKIEKTDNGPSSLKCQTLQKPVSSSQMSIYRTL